MFNSFTAVSTKLNSSRVDKAYLFPQHSQIIQRMNSHLHKNTPISRLPLIQSHCSVPSQPCAQGTPTCKTPFIYSNCSVALHLSTLPHKAYHIQVLSYTFVPSKTVHIKHTHSQLLFKSFRAVSTSTAVNTKHSLSQVVSNAIRASTAVVTKIHTCYGTYIRNSNLT